MIYRQGDLVFVDLNPSKGHEQNKVRPCLIISNNNYNKYFNTIIVIPISSSNKYRTEEKYIQSPIFVPINSRNIEGTALLQHIRTIDPTQRIKGNIVGHIPQNQIKSIVDTLQQFLIYK